MHQENTTNNQTQKITPNKANQENKTNNQIQKSTSTMINQNSSNPSIEKVALFFDGNQLEIDDIHVEIIYKINEHIQANVTGMLKARIYDSYVKDATSETSISINHRIKGEDSLIFRGLIKEIIAHNEGKYNDEAVYFLKMDLVSYSYKLDILNKYRSFQDENKTFDMFLKKVFQDYPTAKFKNHAASSQKLEAWILQYNISDWKLLKQEISKFEQGLFVDATQPYAQIHFGTPKGKNRGTLEQYEYTISKKLHFYSEYDGNELTHEQNEFDFLEYEIIDKHATEVFFLGDSITYQEIKLYISEIFSEIKDNKLYNTYKLTTKKGLKMPRLANIQIQGLSIPGKVIDVKDNRLKLHLKIDEEQPIDKAKWFDYATFYATWYGMPEINDIVNLHFPTLDERDAHGLNSYKQNPEGGYTRNNEVKTPNNTSAAGNKGAIDFIKSASDPDVKLLTTKAGRMIELGPDRICIEYDDNTYIILDDKDGIMLFTNRDIACYAEGEINMDAKKKIHVQAKELITLQSQSSRITISPSTVIVNSKNKKIN